MILVRRHEVSLDDYAESCPCCTRIVRSAGLCDRCEDAGMHQCGYCYKWTTERLVELEAGTGGCPECAEAWHDEEACLTAIAEDAAEQEAPVTRCDYCDAAVDPLGKLESLEPGYRACEGCVPTVRAQLEHERRPICGWCGHDKFRDDNPNGTLVCRMCGALPRNNAA